MGICINKSFKLSNPDTKRPKGARPGGHRISTEILAEFKKGLEIHQPNPDLVQSPRTDNSAFRSQDDKDCISAEITLQPKTREEVQSIEESLLSHFLFRGLSEDIISKLIQEMPSYQLNKKEIIFKQGDPGYNFFIISSGIVEVSVDSVRVKTLERGQGFGELALLHGTERKATIKSLTRVKLWGLARDSFKRIVTIGNQRYYNEIKEFLNTILVFKQLTETQMDALVSSITVQTFNTGEGIIKEKENKPEFYVIKEGKVHIYYKNENLAYLQKGEYFGEQALIYNSTRRASARALCSTVLLMITKDTLIQILGGRLEKVLFFNTVKIAFSNDLVFGKFSSNMSSKISQEMKIKDIKGQVSRYPTEELWVVLKGTVQENNKNHEVYSCINTQELFSEQTYSTDTYSEDATVAVISKGKIQEIIGIELKKIVEYNEIMSRLKKIFLFSLISEKKVEALASLVKEVCIVHGTFIVNQHDPGLEFFIVKNGKVRIVVDGKDVRMLESNEYFGERSLLFDEPRSASVIAEGDCKLWTMTRTVFERVIDASLKLYLMKKCNFLTEKFPISELCFVKLLKQSFYFKEILVRNERFGIDYLLKVIDKEDVEKYNLAKRLVEEKTTHYQVNFQFIPTLVNTYKNLKCLCFLSEYFSGPSLLKIIQDFGGLKIKQVQFYSAAILLSIQYLHSKSIIHRAVAPESIIIDSTGYPILTDLHGCKQTNERTYTILGLTHYMSPEMIKGNGYTHSTDFWSFGILIYEMIFTIVPFGNNVEDPYEIYKSILEDDLRFPVFYKRNLKFTSLLEQLLSKTPGNRGTLDGIMTHGWFDGTPWDSVISKKIVPYFIHDIIEEKEISQEFNYIFQETPVSWAEEF